MERKFTAKPLRTQRKSLTSGIKRKNLQHYFATFVYGRVLATVYARAMATAGYRPHLGGSKVFGSSLSGLGLGEQREDVGSREYYFPVIKSLTILPTIVIPKIMPITIARKIARKRVNLKTRKKRGIKIAHNIIVRQPVAKSFASNIGQSFPFSLSEGVY
jgi:hypothetical protein